MEWSSRRVHTNPNGQTFQFQEVQDKLWFIALKRAQSRPLRNPFESKQITQVQIHQLHAAAYPQSGRAEPACDSTMIRLGKMSKRPGKQGVFSSRGEWLGVASDRLRPIAGPAQCWVTGGFLASAITWPTLKDL